MSGRCWRVVEAQHVVSTMKLVDTLAEQARLEQLLEEHKPPVPPDCRHLHYLLATPFRYGAPYPRGSRFRRAGLTPGVFYASQSPATALAEVAFHRLLFFAESPGTPWPANAAEHTAFAVRFRARSGLALSEPPFAGDLALWSDPGNYEPCQALADAARATGVQALRYRSVRDPRGGLNIALLTCAAFTSREPTERQTWRLALGAAGARAICDSPAARLEFT
ncbi:MAG: RES family NAD+ phosphorylase [Acidobacteriota bacterium]|nr:RES family NAD+ phosphorylase [Acidobacteriota bacterium]